MKPTGATKESAKFTFEVVTGRHKIYRGLDQIATADDSESAQLIIDALNERERLRETVITVVERFQREYHDLTDGQYGSIEDFNEVKELRAALKNDAAGTRGEG